MTRMEEGQTKGMDEPGSSAPSGPPKSEEGIEAICAFPQIPGTIILVMGGVNIDAGEVEVNSYLAPCSP